MADETPLDTIYLHNLLIALSKELVTSRKRVITERAAGRRVSAEMEQKFAKRLEFMLGKNFKPMQRMFGSKSPTKVSTFGPTSFEISEEDEA